MTETFSESEIQTGYCYHIYNRSGHNLKLFKNSRDFRVFLEASRYYLQAKPPVKFSTYKERPEYYKLNFNDQLVTIYAICLMPDHIHLEVKQNQNQGIKKFIHRLCCSYSHYFNIKYCTSGHLFADRFKHKLISTDTQLVHLSRYIHLNPVSSGLVNRPEDWKYSSYNTYIGKGRFDFLDFVDSSRIMRYFSSAKEYEVFVNSRSDYQKYLSIIKNITKNHHYL